MRKRVRNAGLALLLATSACQHLTQGQAGLATDKALFAAETAYAAAASAVEAAADAGLIHGATAADVDAGLRRAHDALVLARAAAQAGDGAAVQAEALAAMAAAASVQQAAKGVTP